MLKRGRILLMAVMVATGPAVMSFPGAGSMARAAEAGTAAMATEAIERYFQALVDGDGKALAAAIAPEFQIMRADGSGYVEAEYLASSLPKIKVMPTIEKLVVSGGGDILVARYFLKIESTRDGKTVAAYAPRLTVLRKVGDTWLVAAHANFAAVEEK
jgi:ketosteroid isomerase-like protein